MEKEAVELSSGLVSPGVVNFRPFVVVTLQKTHGHFFFRFGGFVFRVTVGDGREVAEGRSAVRRNGSSFQVPERRSNQKISPGTSFRSVLPQFNPW